MDSVPCEVWLEIFSILERSHLFALRYVSRSFQRIAGPFIFKHFHFHPYAGLGGHTTGNFLLPSEAKIRRTVRRLRFWASENVAPLVKECTVSPWDGWQGYTSCNGGDMLLCTFIELLPRFTNLRKFGSSSVKFTQPFVDALGSLPNLKEIDVGRCSIDEDVTIDHPLQMEALSFTNMDTTWFRHELNTIGMQRWSSMVDRQMLTHISLPSAEAMKAFLDVDTAPFPNVTTLDAYIDQNTTSLHRFPAVRKLRIVSYEKAFSQRSGSCFPRLEEYHGLPEYLTVLDSRATPRRLQFDLCMPARILRILQPCAHTLRSVTTLAVSFDTLPSAILRPIMESFGVLLDFRMEIKVEWYSQLKPEMHNAKALFLEVAENSPFPRSIKVIALIWRFDKGDNWPLPAVDVLPAARTAWVALKTEHPNLREASFCLARVATPMETSIR
ncbi:hypothetical protein MSAN_01319800 [Mycena sanguinolenta]|uniref:F-box domain-containing protein n=1 Tax=Mycena sanguinolenta TaxID=230812 RepID=A0A8H6YCK9_9AGAR|nr:hypothetical protein MSAN_01319800 [Mycena sanguinolenta]